MTDIRLQRSGSTAPGAILGNYRLLEPLNPGGMGSVFRAEHAVLGRPAAVKILRPELTTNPQLVQRFLNEAKAATLIRHPGIVEVYDFGTAPDGTSYIVMEMLQGVSLAARLAERGRLPEQEAAFIARGVASALKAAHQQGIIHRDLKPANIFLVPDPDGPTGERVKVLDFGIAKLLDPNRAFHTQTGAMIGTPIYMAPEQARAPSSVDHRADLYALGCVLYEMLVGRPPFVSAAPGQLISMHLFTAPDPPRAYVQISPQLDGIVLRLLEKDPATRFQHGGELIDLLDPLIGLAGRPGGDSRPNLAPGFASSMPLSLADERGPREREPKSAMGIIAGVITVGIAAAVGLFIATRGGGDEGEKPAAASGSTEGSGSATATEVAPPVTEPPATPTPTPPTPTPPPPQETASTPPPKEEGSAAKPATTPPRPPRTTPRRPASRPKPGEPSGPVTHPDGPVTKPDSGGPITSPGGVRSPGGAPPAPTPPAKPPEPPPPAPAPPPPDKLPDKPGATGEGGS